MLNVEKARLEESLKEAENETGVQAEKIHSLNDLTTKVEVLDGTVFFSRNFSTKLSS